MNKAVELLKSMIAMGEDHAHMSPSPYMQWLNGQLTEAQEGSVTVKFKVRKEMCNPAKILHGGVIAGMIDEVVGIAVYSLGRPNFFTSIDLNVDFLRPARLGEEIHVHAKVIRNGQRVIHSTANMYKDDKLLAKADTNLIITPEKLPQYV